MPCLAKNFSILLIQIQTKAGNWQHTNLNGFFNQLLEELIFKDGFTKFLFSVCFYMIVFNLIVSAIKFIVSKKKHNQTITKETTLCPYSHIMLLCCIGLMIFLGQSQPVFFFRYWIIISPLFYIVLSYWIYRIFNSDLRFLTDEII